MRSASGAAFATSSRPGSHTELSMWATPNSAAALTTGAAPPGWKLSSEPTGQNTTGSRSLRPNTSVETSILLTSRSTRGRNAIESSAMRLRRSVVSVSTAPTM